MSDPVARSGDVLNGDDGYAMEFQSFVFSETLKDLLPQLQNGDWPKNRLVLPFTLTCAAALEARLNDDLVKFAFSELGAADYRRPAEAYVSMSLRAKLDLFVSVLTKGRFVIRADSHEYGILARLIRVRNELVHAKSFYLSGVILDEELQPSLNESIVAAMQRKAVWSLSSKDCAEYYGALNALDELFLFFSLGAW